MSPQPQISDFSLLLSHCGGVILTFKVSFRMSPQPERKREIFFSIMCILIYKNAMFSWKDRTIPHANYMFYSLLSNPNLSLLLLHVVAMVTNLIESNQFKYQLSIHNFLSNHDRKII